MAGASIVRVNFIRDTDRMMIITGLELPVCPVQGQFLKLSQQLRQGYQWPDENARKFFEDHDGSVWLIKEVYIDLAALTAFDFTVGHYCVCSLVADKPAPTKRRPRLSVIQGEQNE